MRHTDLRKTTVRFLNRKYSKIIALYSNFQQVFLHLFLSLVQLTGNNRFITYNATGMGNVRRE